MYKLKRVVYSFMMYFGVVAMFTSQQKEYEYMSIPDAIVLSMLRIGSFVVLFALVFGGLILLVNSFGEEGK